MRSYAESVITEVNDCKMSEQKPRTIIIKDKKNGVVLAKAQVGRGVRLFEGVWYFEPEFVHQEYLQVTQRTYTCHYKGVCYWIDLNLPNHAAKNVAFTYFDVNEGYEFILGRNSGRNHPWFRRGRIGANTDGPDDGRRTLDFV
ncbi:MAG: DUF427 domain-containing protein [Chloroflexi bacterium]|nr:MAG: DUF427 domain-containing protein [Chloroflexota bacterium]